jgi:hypothetical protein
MLWKCHLIEKDPEAVAKVPPNVLAPGLEQLLIPLKPG